MARTRVSTTVDGELLAEARAASGVDTNAELLDQALRALLDRNRRVAIDDAYVAYEEHPVDEVDEWGDLASFRSAAAAS